MNRKASQAADEPVNVSKAVLVLLIVILGVVVLFGVTFRNYVIVKRIERKLENSVRNDSLKNLHDK